ncbi:MAG: fused isobutyryl-CoA mutase/GTPase IcmF [Candidatus Krumholzibacteriia bacterium]
MDSTAPTTQTGARLRYVTAAALFDGHDASINIIRRLLQQSGAEVIHLGHTRSVPEVVSAVLQEDADAVAVSSYQGGHVEYFTFLRQELVARGLGHVAIFGGGGGVILPAEIAALHDAGITRIYSPDDGRSLGLEGMIADMNVRARAARDARPAGLPARADGTLPADDAAFAHALTLAEAGEAVRPPAGVAAVPGRAPVVGITGTGGAGKSSLTDELVRRFLQAHPEQAVALLAVDPSKRRTGGALLGDRIRMNAIHDPRCFLRSFATRGARGELSAAVGAAIALARAWGFDLILVETSGIGQGDSAIAEISDISLYVMTSEFGAATQLEKIDMIDFADVIVVNKYERPGAEDALRDVRRQYRRSRNEFARPDGQLPVFGTVASRFNDSGVNALFACLERLLGCARDGRPLAEGLAGPAGEPRATAQVGTLIPRHRVGYLGEIARSVRAHRDGAARDAALVRRCQNLAAALDELEAATDTGARAAAGALRRHLEAARAAAGEAVLAEVAGWDGLAAGVAGEELVFRVRDREVRTAAHTVTLAGTRVPKVALPALHDAGDRLLFLRRENLPGAFPFTAGVFPFKRADEDPRRQFAGEGGPARTNARFHYLSRHDEAKRLSTAFDSLTLYGEDPDRRPDIYGKIGEGGVSICTLDDMKTLYAGFDLCHPNTSVSMTINGPAPVILAMFFNTAIDQQVARREAELGRPLTAAEGAEVAARTLAGVRGTVQADILKEDQAQNTCIFSTEFALRLMGDVQAYFLEHDIRNYYSVSISGYHIAEAGANPISQLAFTLANGFTYVEAWRARGMEVDAFAPNLSFFFSNGLDAEYTVIGRVARRIWAVAMRDLYGAGERSQKLKYHIQTSGRSLHAQEVDFNDIRTTLQALMAIFDNCNSLHTNSYDEAITTPSEESVRRAMAIQLIISRELGWARNENPLQGSAFIEALTDLVEEAVLREFECIDARGGVLGAMETQYQRSRIQEESLLYEHRKHAGELPIVGVNMFVRERPADETVAQLVLARCGAGEKEARLTDLAAFQARHAGAADAALARLREVALSDGNVFAELMRAVRVCSLGQITHALYQVGGQYRRAM